MNDEEKSTEVQLSNIFDLYEHDMLGWDEDIYLDELEMLYNMRERINEIILLMKRDIRLVLTGESKE